MISLFRKGILRFMGSLIVPDLYKSAHPTKNKLKHLEGKFVKMPDAYARFSLQKLHGAVLYVDKVSKPFGAVNDCVYHNELRDQCEWNVEVYVLTTDLQKERLVYVCLDAVFEEIE